MSKKKKHKRKKPWPPPRPAGYKEKKQGLEEEFDDEIDREPEEESFEAPEEKPLDRASRYTTERLNRHIDRIVESGKANTPEDLKRYMENFVGRKKIDDVIAGEKLNREDMAQEIAFQAMEADNPKEMVTLTSKALLLDPDCTDALVIKAISSSYTRTEAIEKIKHAVLVAEKRLGTKYFEENRGHFWGLVKTRPYMRARARLMDLYHQEGKLSDAIREAEEMLDLNPNDNQGIRDNLLVLYLQTGNLEGARRLQKQYENSISAIYLWGHALERFLSGNIKEAEKSLQEAQKRNPHVIDYLLGKKRPPKKLPEYYSFGDVTEAIFCRDLLQKAWNVKPDAIEWLKSWAAQNVVGSNDSKIIKLKSDEVEDDKKNEAVELELSPEERRLILNMPMAPEDLSKRLRFFEEDNQNKTFCVSYGELEELADNLAAYAENIKDELEKQIIEGLLDKFEEIIYGYMPPRKPDLVFDSITASPPDTKAELEEIRFSKDDSEKSLERFSEVLAKYVMKPEPQFGNLSLFQVKALTDDEWQNDAFPMRLNDRLPLLQLQSSSLLMNSRVVLHEILKAGRVKATSAGNLNRKTTHKILSKYITIKSPGLFPDIDTNKFNEQHIFDIHKPRVLMQLSGLLRLKKGYFHVTKKGAEMFKEESAGELYSTLFRIHFTKYNISYLDRLPDCNELQKSIAYTFYRLSKCANDWIDVEKIPQEILMPAVIKAIRINTPQYDWTLGIISLRVLEPLEEFGLIELEYAPDEHGVNTLKRVRKTPLFDMFMSFDFQKIISELNGDF